MYFGLKNSWVNRFSCLYPISRLKEQPRAAAFSKTKTSICVTLTRCNHFRLPNFFICTYILNWFRIPGSAKMISYDLLVEVMRFLRHDELDKLELVCEWTRKAVKEHGSYWPFKRCYRLTFLEVFLETMKYNGLTHFFPSITRLTHWHECKTWAIILSNFRCIKEVWKFLNQNFQLALDTKLQSAQLPADDNQIPLFLDETEPTFLLFEFASSRKFFVQLQPFLNRVNVEYVVFWLHQVANVFFEEEIRGLLDMRKFRWWRLYSFVFPYFQSCLHWMASGEWFQQHFAFPLQNLRLLRIWGIWWGSTYSLTLIGTYLFHASFSVKCPISDEPYQHAALGQSKWDHLLSSIAWIFA